jgi:hypothetical protein
MSLRVNIGCGQTPTEGWNNYDNSLAVRIARIPIIPDIASKLGPHQNLRLNLLTSPQFKDEMG